MKKIFNSLFFVGAMLFASVASAETLAGYTNCTIDNTKNVRFGSTEKQGVAIYVDAEKAAVLKGGTVQKFLAYVTTRNIENGTLFITKDLNGEPLCTQSFKPSSSRAKMYEYLLDTPYVLDGEPFYFGFVLEATTNYKPLSFDNSSNTQAGLSWAYENGSWIDISEQGFGVPNVQLGVDGVSSFIDLMVKPLRPEGYQVAGTPQVFNGQLFNFGSETITSFDITCKVGEADPVVSKVEGVSVASGETYDFTLPEYLTDESGSLDLEVSVTNVNASTDADESDNTAISSVFFYPKGVEKKILVEVFTGQTCGNCPTGHTNLANAMSGIEDEFIEVAHHAGYYPDQFTLAESYSYTWLYGSSGTYAPAAAFNRTAIPSISTTSAVFASTDASSVRTAVQAFRTTQPYVGLKLYNEFDTLARKGSVVVEVETFVVPSDSMHTLNVWLTQNGLVGVQASAGANYVHNHVFRGTLNGNAWGHQILLKAGESKRYTFEYEIPDSIETTYGDYKGNLFEAIPANMELVAFVSDFSSTDVLGCKVYNAAKIAVLTDNMSSDGIEEAVVETSRQPVVSLNGNQVTVLCNHLGVEVYSIEGTRMASVSAGESSFTLPSGIYIVSVRKMDGTIAVDKLLVR